MPNFDFNAAAKQVCDGTATGINRYFISIALKVGQNAVVVAMTPEDAKNFAENMAKTVGTYEQSFGKIPESGKPIPSPIDLSKPEDGK